MGPTISLYSQLCNENKGFESLSLHATCYSHYWTQLIFLCLGSVGNKVKRLFFFWSDVDTHHRVCTGCFILKSRFASPLVSDFLCGLICSGVCSDAQLCRQKRFSGKHTRVKSSAVFSVSAVSSRLILVCGGKTPWHDDRPHDNYYLEGISMSACWQGHCCTSHSPLSSTAPVPVWDILTCSMSLDVPQLCWLMTHLTLW